MDPAGSADLYFHAAIQAHQHGDLETADRHYRAVLAQAPKHPAACNDLGLTLAVRGRMGEAIALFRRALSAAPASAGAAMNLAQALQHDGEPAGAVEAWRTAAALLPEDMEPPLDAAIACLQQGDRDPAVEWLRQAAARTPRREGTRAALLHHIRVIAGECIDDGALGPGHDLASLPCRLEPGDEMGQRMPSEINKPMRQA